MASKKLKKHERLDRMAAKVDKDGNIMVAIRGPGVVFETGIEAGTWVGLEDDLRAIEATLPEKQPQLKVGANGKVGLKPKVRVGIDKTSIASDGVDAAKVKLIPVTDGLPPDIELSVNGKTMRVAPGEEVLVTSDVAQRLTITVSDRRVLSNIKMVIARQ